MGDLIDRDNLIYEIEHNLWDWESVDGITATTVLKQTITDIKNQPMVKAIPVRYTYLRRSRIYPGAYECSECGVSYPQYVKNNGLILNYCSKCGAKFMRGDETRREE